jgi:hypothetical protein
LFATGVAQNPDSVAAVRSANVVRSHNSPARIIPHFGKVTEDHGKSSLNKQWAVFHEDESRLNLADNARHLSPQSRLLAGNSGAFAGGTDVGAWEAARNDFSNSSPRSSVKGSHVIPDGKRLQASVVLSRDKNACGVGVVFNGADGVPPKEFASEYSATSACEKSQLIHESSSSPSSYGSNGTP